MKRIVFIVMLALIGFGAHSQVTFPEGQTREQVKAECNVCSWSEARTVTTGEVCLVGKGISKSYVYFFGSTGLLEETDVYMTYDDWVWTQQIFSLSNYTYLGGDWWSTTVRGRTFYIRFIIMEGNYVVTYANKR